MLVVACGSDRATSAQPDTHSGGAAGGNVAESGAPDKGNDSGGPPSTGGASGMGGTGPESALGGDSSEGGDAALQGASLAVAPNYACAIATGGIVKCWGNDANDRFTSSPSETDNCYELVGNVVGNQVPCSPQPVAVVGQTGSVVAISAGSNGVCGLTGAGELQCWGDSSIRQLPPDLRGPFTAVSVGAGFACAITKGSVTCWGSQVSNENGKVQGLADAIVVSAGASSACSLTASGGVKCWGFNTNGQLGNGSMSDSFSLTAVQVVGLTRGVSQVAVGFAGACALTTAGSVQCWGDFTTLGVVPGNVVNPDSAVPVQVVGLTSGVKSVAVGGAQKSSACAITSSSGVECWGWNEEYQKYDSTPAADPLLAAVIGTGVKSVSVGNGFACAEVQGGIQCWGESTQGQLGDGMLNPSSIPPPPVSGL